MRMPVLAANWKMHQGPSAAAAFMERFLGVYSARDDRTIIVFPPAVSIAAVAAHAAARRDILVGVQNIYWEAKGAFTGEISAPMAYEAGARVALVGHSERRHVFGESDGDTARKCAAAVRQGLTMLLCVGETLAERERGDTERVVMRQLSAALADLDGGAIASSIIAYEPVWAIGTGRTAKPEDASVVHGVIRASLHGRIGRDADAVPILYGGSVNAANAAQLLGASGVNGLLVGGASLDPESWSAICAT